MDTMENYSEDCDVLSITRDIIGRNLRKGRLEKNWSQSKTGLEAGSCQATVANLEAGKAKNPELSTIVNHGVAVGKDLCDLTVGLKEKIKKESNSNK